MLCFVFSSFAALIGVFNLLQYIFGIDLKIDELVFVDFEGIRQRYPPGRLAPITAISFVLLWTAHYVAFFIRRPKYRLGQISVESVKNFGSRLYFEITLKNLPK